MSYGLPVISSNEGAIAEIVKDEVSGFIVDAKSPREIAGKILQLVNNPQLRENIGTRVRTLQRKI